MLEFVLCIWLDGMAEQAALLPRLRAGHQPWQCHALRRGWAGSQGFRAIHWIVSSGPYLIAFDDGPHVTFPPAISLLVKCRDQAAIDGFRERLSDGGKTGRCGCSDRSGGRFPVDRADHPGWAAGRCRPIPAAPRWWADRIMRDRPQGAHPHSRIEPDAEAAFLSQHGRDAKGFAERWTW